MKKSSLIPGVLLAAGLFSAGVFGQVPIGGWQTHLPYYYCTKIMVAPDRVFCSSTGGLFYFDQADNSINTLTKTEGLSDNGVTTMNWSDDDQLALLAFNNANIDILKDNEIINIPDIYKKQIPGDKTIYNIYFEDHKALLSCGFGIVVLDLEKYEITDTYYIGDQGDALRISQVASDNTYLYAATAEGIRFAEKDHPFLIDFNTWQLLEDLPEPGAFYSGIASYAGALFTVYEGTNGEPDKLYYRENDTWKEFTGISDEELYEIRVEEDLLVVTGNQSVFTINDNLLLADVLTAGSPRSAGLDREGNLWVADFGKGMVYYGSDGENTYRPNGPYSSNVYDITSADGVVFAVPGGVNRAYNNLFQSASLYTYRNQRWRSNINYEYRDILSLAVHPGDPVHLFGGTWGYVLLEYRDEEIINAYDESNSSLQNIIPGGEAVRIGGIAFDQQNNLWMTNTGVSEPVSVRRADGSWKSFSVDGLLSDFPALGEVLVTRDGYIWSYIPRGNGLFAMDISGTIDNEDDDTYKLVSVEDENGKVITNEVYSMAEDQNGNIWLGTNQGILVYYSPSRLFTEDRLYAQEIIVPRNDDSGLGDPLLQTQKVTCIEVDGANRKWLGTENGGAFLVSENGLEQIYNFNESNSPLLSNSITDICVNGENGEVFFGTDRGMISFRGEATEGATNYSDVKVFPNPVRPDYRGEIAISGLVEETTVKITDVSGNLVYETESFGGQAIWNGKDLSGNRVATGVYLVFLANRDGTRAHVTKILFIH